MDDLKELSLSALVIEQQSLAQSHIKYSLQNMGFDRIDFVDRAHLAVESLQKRQYDLVLCAYELNKGGDGYQLFERICQQSLLHEGTAFVFMSSEQDMSLSQSIIELEPDDFILKPFTSKELETRLRRILIKKLTLKDVFDNLEMGDVTGALHSLNQYIADNDKPNWMPYLMRLKGAILIKTKDWKEVAAFYKSVLKIKTFPWAELGLVESYLQLNKLKEAEALLKDLVNNPSTKLAALDLLGLLKEHKNDFNAALKYIKAASTISPRNIERQKHVIDLARLTQDFESQYTAHNTIIKHLKHSVHDAPDLYLNAIRANIDYGLTTFNETEVQRIAQQSQHILDSLKKKFPKAALDEEIDIATARIHYLKDEIDKAKHLLKLKMEDGNAVDLDNLEASLDVAKALHEVGFHKDSERVFEELVKAAAGTNNPLFSRYLNTEKKLREDVKHSPKELNNIAVAYYTRGQLQDALNTFRVAFKIMPKNAAIALNLLQTIAESQFLDRKAKDIKVLIAQCADAIKSTNLSEEQIERFEKIKTALNEKRV